MLNKNRFLLSAFAVLVSAAAFGQIKMKCSVADGQTIKGVQEFKVTIESKHLVNDVEFYVGDDLRSTDDSTPYEFIVDTVAEAEGPLKVKLLAYDSEGGKAEIMLNLKVDNEVGKGADFHVDLGKDALSEGKWEEAIMQGRIALKAKAKYIPARMLLARANYGKGLYDAAQKFVEGILAEDPNNIEALDLKSAVALESAFGARTGSRDTQIVAIGNALKMAAESRAKVYTTQLDAFGAINEENRIKWADLAIRAGRYSAVISELAPQYRANIQNSSIVNRYLYSLIRAGRDRTAMEVAQQYAKRGVPDAAGYALIALTYEKAGDSATAESMEREAIKSDSTDLTVRSALAYLAMSRGRSSAFVQFVNDLGQEEDFRFEVLSYRSQASYLGNDYEGARNYFEEAVLNEPTASDTYVQRSVQLMAYGTDPGLTPEDRGYYFGLAKVFLDAALVARPESYEALTGLSIMNMMGNKAAEGLSLAQSAAAAGPEYAAAHYQLAFCASVVANTYNVQSQALESQAEDLKRNRQFDEEAKVRKSSVEARDYSKKMSNLADSSLKKAGELDKKNLAGRSLPNLNESWIYYVRYGRTPMLIPPQY